MKRISRKIRKRLSLTSNERRSSVKDIYSGVAHVRQLPIPQIPDGQSQSAYIFSPNNCNNGNRVRAVSEPVPDMADEGIEHHDYSTLDGEGDDDAFHDSPNKLSAVDPKTDESSDCPNAKSPNVPSGGDIKEIGDTCQHTVYPTSPVLLEFEKLARQGWYWGPMTREQAEKRLSNAPEASFLVRDSSDERYILSLSFRSHHRTLHTRIAHSGMKFSFYEDNPKQAYTSVVELIENSMRDTNEQGVFCYSRSRQPFAPTFPVRLIHPVSRFTEVRPLQDLCRFVIRRSARVDHIQNLPLPKPIKDYLHHSYF